MSTYITGESGVVCIVPLHTLFGGVRIERSPKQLAGHVLMKRPCLLVDAMNVIGSRPTGWWRDRNGAILGFARDLRALAETDGQSIVLVIDGQPLAELPEGQHGNLDVLYAATSGPNAADDRIVEFIAVAPDPDRLEVVTADRDLAGRVRLHGARVSGPARLLGRLDEITYPQ